MANNVSDWLRQHCVVLLSRFFHIVFQSVHIDQTKVIYHHFDARNRLTVTLKSSLPLFQEIKVKTQGESLKMSEYVLIMFFP